MKTGEVEQIYICGVTCTKGSPECNGYCTDGRIPAPGKHVIELMDIGGAIEAVKAGKKVARRGWNGRNMFVYYVPAAAYPAQTGAARSVYGQNGMVPYNAYLALRGVDNAVSTWAPSCSDALAEDWHVVP